MPPSSKLKKRRPINAQPHTEKVQPRAERPQLEKVGRQSYIDGLPDFSGPDFMVASAPCKQDDLKASQPHSRSSKAKVKHRSSTRPERATKAPRAPVSKTPSDRRRHHSIRHTDSGRSQQRNTRAHDQTCQRSNLSLRDENLGLRYPKTEDLLDFMIKNASSSSRVSEASVAPPSHRRPSYHTKRTNSSLYREVRRRTNAPIIISPRRSVLVAQNLPPTQPLRIPEKKSSLSRPPSIARQFSIRSDVMSEFDAGSIYSNDDEEISLRALHGVDEDDHEYEQPTESAVEPAWKDEHRLSLHPDLQHVLTSIQDTLSTD